MNFIHWVGAGRIPLIATDNKKDTYLSSPSISGFEST